MVPTWQGSRMSLTSEMADASLEMLHRAAHANDAWFAGEPEMRAVRPLLELQQRWSALPETGRLVCKILETGEGHHFFSMPSPVASRAPGWARWSRGARAARDGDGEDPWTRPKTVRERGYVKRVRTSGKRQSRSAAL